MKQIRNLLNLPNSIDKLNLKTDAITAQLKSLATEFDVQKTTPDYEDKHEIRLAALEAAALSKQGVTSNPKSAPIEIRSIPHWDELLSSTYPELFPLWHKLYNAALPFYNESIEASCSTWENKFATGFRDYLRIFADGYLLDIGSGILTRPVYLEGYPENILRGIDPREADNNAEFKILTGVNEFLPWKDNSFQTVCNATSLDHVIDMEKSLDETARVLSPGGKFVLWYAHIDGATPPPKVPLISEDGEPIGTDEFHIFHINDEWFMPMLNKRFVLRDRRVFALSGFSHVFACYTKR